MIYAPSMFPLNVVKINMYQSFTEIKILMRKITKLIKTSPQALTLSVQSKLISLERDLISSYQKEKMFEESLAVKKN